jgi:hypothetical protein
MNIFLIYYYVSQKIVSKYFVLECGMRKIFVNLGNLLLWHFSGFWWGCFGGVFGSFFGAFSIFNSCFSINFPRIFQKINSKFQLNFHPNHYPENPRENEENSFTKQLYNFPLYPEKQRQ